MNILDFLGCKTLNAVSRFVLKGPCYNPLDVMNCLMTRRGYKVSSSLRDCYILYKFLEQRGHFFLQMNWIQRSYCRKGQFWFTETRLDQKKQISSKRDLDWRRPTFLGARKPSTTDPPKHSQQGWQVRMNGEREEKWKKMGRWEVADEDLDKKKEEDSGLS